MRPGCSLLLVTCVVTGCGGGPGTSVEAAPAPDSGPRTPTVVQPGAPGEGVRRISGTDLPRASDVGFTEADVQFMQGMIHHHAQALAMTALVPDRTRSAAFRQLALRMEISQADEIQLMSRWLGDRGQTVPDPDHHMQHRMPGMLTSEQMESLRAADGDTFEQRFLEFMIQHHEGALQMVATLFTSHGGGQDSEIFQFATDVDADQRAEIQRMRQMLDAG